MRREGSLEILSLRTTTLIDWSISPSIVLNRSKVYVVRQGLASQSQIMSMPMSGGQSAVEIKPDTYFGSMDAVGFDASHIYWNEGKGFFRMPLGGGSTPQKLSRHFETKDVLHVDSTHVYSLTASWDMKRAHPAWLNRIPKRGGCREILAAFPRTPEVAFDSVSIYWKEPATGEVKAMRK